MPYTRIHAVTSLARVERCGARPRARNASRVSRRGAFAFCARGVTSRGSAGSAPPWLRARRRRERHLARTPGPASLAGVELLASPERARRARRARSRRGQPGARARRGACGRPSQRRRCELARRSASNARTSRGRVPSRPACDSTRLNTSSAAARTNSRSGSGPQATMLRRWGAGPHRGRAAQGTLPTDPACDSCGAKIAVMGPSVKFWL
jgi:hypothetical protein